MRLIIPLLTLTLIAFVSATNQNLNQYSYELNDTQESRKLQPSCNSADIFCNIIIDDEVSDLSCEDHLRIRRVDCPSGREVFVPVEVEYSYCNEQGPNVLQKADQAVTHAIYKGAEVEIPGMSNNLFGGQCNTVKIRRSINLCTAGASMRMQYGSVNLDESGGLTQEYCYSFKFLQARRIWLESGVCAIQAEVSCRINQPLGQLNNKPCKGNIIRDEPGFCRDVPVKFTFEVCNYFIPAGGTDENSFNYKYVFKRNQPDPAQLPKSFAVLDKVQVDFPFSPLGVNERCRSITKYETINTCDTERTPARLRVRGRMAGVEDCGSYSFYSVKPTVDVDCQFIITEIADPLNNPLHRFVEIYALNEKCWGNDVATVDQYLVIYNNKSTRPSRYYPIPLQGITVAPDGFHVFCASLEGQTHYGKHENTGEFLCDSVSGEGSAADSDGNDQIAIINGSINDEFDILDIYGVVGESGTNTPRNFRDGRIVRNFDATEQNNGVYSTNDFFVERPISTGATDPHFWGPKFPPTLPPTPLPQTCEGLEENILITEIVSEGNIRYVELHNLRFLESNCENAKIVREMTLDLLDSNGNAIPENRINLKDLVFSDFGFIVLCATIETKALYPYRCSHLVKPESVAGTNGNVSIIALQIEDTISDVFGMVGSSCSGERNYCFDGGSAYRQKDIAKVTGPRDTFTWLNNPNAPNGGSWYQWDIYRNQMRNPDPDEWIVERPVPEPSSIPTITPTLSTKPSSMPTIAPTLSTEPSAIPTIAPTLSTKPPTIPTVAPTPNPCPNLAESIIMTEIVAESPVRNFLELHNLNHEMDGCHEAVITQDMYLDVLDSNGPVSNTQSIPLKGMQFSPEGFIVLCTNPTTNYIFEGKCTHVLSGTNNAAGTNGQASAIAIQIHDGTNKKISDVFGIPGEPCFSSYNRPSYCFNGGSAVRQREVTTGPNDQFIPYNTFNGIFWYQWDISAYANTRDPDPNEWKYKDNTPTPSTSPSAKPVNEKGKGKGKGKGGSHSGGTKSSKRHRNLRT